MTQRYGPLSRHVAEPVQVEPSPASAANYTTSENDDVGTTASALGTSFSCKEVLVQADPDNTDIVRIGTSAGQYIALEAGADITLPISNVADVYVKSDSGTQVVNYLARA